MYVYIKASYKQIQSFFHDRTKSIKKQEKKKRKKKGDNLTDRFCPRSTDLNQGKYHVE